MRHPAWVSSLLVVVSTFLIPEVKIPFDVHVSIAIEGIGAGGIASLTQIIISDLVPLHERGAYNALVSM